MGMSSVFKKLLKHTAVYGLSSIVGRLLNYLLVPLYTQLFVPAEYGVVTDMYAYVGFLFVLLTYGMETAFFRYTESSNKERDVAFSSAISALAVSSGVFILFMMIFAQPVAELLMYPNNPEYVVIFALIVGVDAFVALPFAKLRSENKAIKFAIFKFINIGLNIGLNLFFLLLCPFLLKHNPDLYLISYYKPEFGVGYIFLSNLIASLVTLLLFIPSLFKMRYSFSGALLKKMLLYGSPLLFAGLAGMVNEVIDRVLLKYLINIPADIVNEREYILSQIGIYGANYKLSILMTLFIQAFRYAAEPLFFSQRDRQDAKIIYANIMKYFVIFGLFIFLGIMLYLDIAKYFINSRYWQGLTIVPILLLANLFLGIVYNLSIWYKLIDKTYFGAIIAGGGAVVTLVMNFVLIPLLGYLGSAWATFACYFIMMVGSYLLGRNHYRINYDFKAIGMYTLLALGIYFASLYDVAIVWLQYVVNTALLFAFVGVVFYREGLLKLIKSFLKKRRVG